MRNTYKPRMNVQFKNKLNGELVVGDIINEEDIEGKQFWVVLSNKRPLKIAKDAYTIQGKK